MSRDYLAGDFGNLIERIADHLRAGSGDAPQIVIGPVVWEPAPAGRRWYFVVASSGGDGFRTDALVADTRDLADAMRSALRLTLLQRRPIVVHDTDDELRMARLCAVIWPCRKTEAIAADTEAERYGVRH